MSTSKNVFLSSCYDDYPRMQRYAKLLEDKGYAVVSNWIQGNQRVDVDIFNNVDVALADSEDIDNCDMFIVFTDSKLNTSLGDPYVQLGMVLENNKRMHVAKPFVEIYLVGPRTNYYTYFIRYQFETFQHLLEKL